MKRKREITRIDLIPSADAFKHVESLQNIRTADESEIEKLCSAPGTWLFGDYPVDALQKAVAQYLSMNTWSGKEFIESVMLPLVDAAMEFRSLFQCESVADAEHFTSIWLNRKDYTLTRRQLHSILAHAFFCTFSTRDEVYYRELEMPTISYAEVHCSRHQVCVVKLLMFFDFVRTMVGKETALLEEHGPFHVTRCSFTASASFLENENERVPLPVVHPLGESIDDQDEMFRLDFANRWVGGGCLSDGCVQEEITFAQCCELNCLRWNHSPLCRKESLVVTGYVQCAAIKEGTYGFRMQYGERFAVPVWRGGALAVVDAVDYRAFNRARQYRSKSIMRELMKLCSAFQCVSVQMVTDVAGGNWGCGVFEGDYELKFLIQWLACALNGKTLHYFPFDNDAFANFVPQLSSLALTRGQLHDFLLKENLIPSKSNPDSVWEKLLKYGEQNI